MASLFVLKLHNHFMYTVLVQGIAFMLENGTIYDTPHLFCKHCSSILRHRSGSRHQNMFYCSHFHWPLHMWHNGSRNNIHSHAELLHTCSFFPKRKWDKITLIWPQFWPQPYGQMRDFKILICWGKPRAWLTHYKLDPSNGSISC